MSKTLKGGPLGFFNIHSVGKYQKIVGGPFGKIIFSRKKSQSPLSFLDDAKILRKLLKK